MQADKKAHLPSAVINIKEMHIHSFYVFLIYICCFVVLPIKCFAAFFTLRTVQGSVMNGITKQKVARNPKHSFCKREHGGCPSAVRAAMTLTYESRCLISEDQIKSICET